MFWGLIMEPGKKYSQKVEKSFHVSHAALDLDTASGEPVQVLLGFDNRNYLICSLQKGHWIQAPLDLNFQVGDKVSFATNGPGHVHLTGYLVPEDDFDMDEEAEEEEEEIPDLVPAKKRKTQGNNKEQVLKKSKTALLLDQVNEDDSDNSDDSDVDMTDILDCETDEEDEEEDGDDEEMEDESEEDEVVPPKKSPKKVESPAKQNGVAKMKKEKSPKQNQTPVKDKTSGKTPQSDKQEQKKEKTPKGQKTPAKDGTPMKKIIEGGVIIEELKLGDGPSAKTGNLVKVYYEGRLKSNNKMFDSSNTGPGFKFRLGRQEVIKGWDVGVAGMKVGGKRRIVCPPNMAYGAQGSPPVIPPSSTLVFDVELKHVKQINH